MTSQQAVDFVRERISKCKKLSEERLGLGNLGIGLGTLGEG